MEFPSRIYCHKRSKFRGIFNWICVLVFLCLFAGQEQIFQSLFSKKPLKNLAQNSHLKNEFVETSVFRRKVFEQNLNLSSENGTQNRELENPNFILGSGYPTTCSGIYQHKGYNTKCEYLRSNRKCNAGRFLGYLEFFYCDCEKFKALGYVVLVIWLLVLFYVLGNTAADYFCCSLEILSNLLRLPPTVSGVTLLPLGNGAPDVFASIASFVGRDSGNVGLNSVLGGAVFVTCVVVGTVSFSIAGQTVRIDKKCFFRDVGFFIFTLLSLLCILLVGKVSVGGAIAFVLIYLVYGLFVAAKEILRKYGNRLKLGSVTHLLPVTGSAMSCENAEDESVYTSLLQPDSEQTVPHLKSHIPRCVRHSNETASNGDHQKKFWGWSEEDSGNGQSFSCSKLWSLLEFPLMLPRRLTIPIVEDERWSKFFAVASAFFAPVVLAVLWNTQEDSGHLAKGIIYVVGFVVGGILGVLALLYTKTEHPPRKFLLPWVLGGFFMSMIWFYVIASELVALLVAFGVILGIKSSLLALTILAWGNSLGDLMANVAIAMNGGDGVQVAISGCFAGPMFNTLVGLGVSLLIGAWSKKPSVYVIPQDVTLYYTLGFLMLGLVWSLVMLPRNGGMRPGKLLGAGLMIIYLSFITVRASIAISDGTHNGSS